MKVARRARVSVSDALRLAAERTYVGADEPSLAELTKLLRDRRFRNDRRFRWNRSHSASKRV